MDDHGTDTHGGSATPIGPCDLARVLQDGLRSLEQALRNLSRGAQLPPDVAVEIGDARRFVACAHEEARQLAVLLHAPAHVAAWTAWDLDLREAVLPLASQQITAAGALTARLAVVLGALCPQRVAASALAFAIEGRVPKEAILHLDWIERWLLLFGAAITRALVLLDAGAVPDDAAASGDSAASRATEPGRHDRLPAPSSRPRRSPSLPGKHLL